MYYVNIYLYINLHVFGKPAGHREVAQGSLMCTLGGGSRRKKVEAWEAYEGRKKQGKPKKQPAYLCMQAAGWTPIDRMPN